MKLTRLQKYLGYMVLLAVSLYICYQTLQTQKRIKEGMTDAARKSIDDEVAPMTTDRKTCKKNCIDNDKGDKDDCVTACYDTCITKCPVSWDILGYPEPDCNDKTKFPSFRDKRFCQDFKTRMNYIFKDCTDACGLDPNPYLSAEQLKSK